MAKIVLKIILSLLKCWLRAWCTTSVQSKPRDISVKLLLSIIADKQWDWCSRPSLSNAQMHDLFAIGIGSNIIHGNVCEILWIDGEGRMVYL